MKTSHFVPILTVNLYRYIQPLDFS